MMPPSGAHIIEYWARPTARRAGVAHERAGQAVPGARSADPELAHVRQVEQTGRAPDLRVLLEDAPVLDGHLPAAEVDEPGAERARVRACSGVSRSAGVCACGLAASPVRQWQRAGDHARARWGSS